MFTIQPQYLTLSKLFDSRLFRIPEYQRAYSWTSHQRQDLFDDIRKTFEKGDDAAHFMAAVVCLRRSTQKLGTDHYFVMDVVDGQQRLTTLIILLNALKLSLDENVKAERRLAEELSELLIKPEGDEPLLLQTNHDSSHHFSNYLRKGTPAESRTAKTLADREILEAMEECQVFIEEWEEQGESLLELASLLKNRMYFLLHEIDDEQTVYTVFEVLNSRGLDVSWIDRLKSILMGAAFDLAAVNQKGIISDLHRTWRDIYSVVGLRQGMSTEALRFASTLRSNDAPNRPLGEQDSVDVLRQEGTDAKSIRNVASWLLQVVKACDVVVANPRINAVTRISQARLLATAINLREDISPKDKEALLKTWEKVSFRIYGLHGFDARTRVGEYVRLAWKINNKKPKVSEIKDAILEIGADFDIDDAIDRLRGGNCYEGWEHELRYLMYRYEEHLAATQKMKFKNEQWEKIWMVSPSDSIEHVWARSKAVPKHRHRLGNLVLLPPKLNSKLQDRPADKKSDEYRKTGLLIARDVADRIDSGAWDGKAITEREEEILEWAAKEWAD